MAALASGARIARAAFSALSPSPDSFSPACVPILPSRYIARARTAKATTKVNDMLSEVGSSSAVAAFERMKDKVEALEAEAETQREMKALSGGAAPASVESKFKVRAAWAGRAPFRCCPCAADW